MCGAYLEKNTFVFSGQTQIAGTFLSGWIKCKGSALPLLT